MLELEHKGVDGVRRIDGTRDWDAEGGRMFGS